MKKYTLDSVPTTSRDRIVRALVDKLHAKKDTFENAVQVFGIQNQLEQIKEEIMSFAIVAHDGITAEAVYKACDLLVMFPQIQAGLDKELTLGQDVPALSKRVTSVLEAGVGMSHYSREKISDTQLEDLCAKSMTSIIWGLEQERVNYSLDVLDRKIENLEKITEIQKLRNLAETSVELAPKPSSRRSMK